MFCIIIFYILVKILLVQMKTVKTKEQAVRYEEWVNKSTGEVREFAVIDKPYQSDFNFHKVWLEDLAKILGILGGQKIAVFNYILKHINPYSNEFGGTMREISEKSEVSLPVVQETIKILITNDFMRKIRTGQYLINSRFLVKGTHNKRVGIMLKYDELNEGRQLGMFSPDSSLNAFDNDNNT